MWSPTRTQAFRHNVPQARPSWDSRSGAPSLSTFTSSPEHARFPHLFCVQTPAKLPSLVQRRRSQTEATKHNYPFADLNEEDCTISAISLACTPTAQRTTNTVSEIRRARSNSVIVSSACSTTSPSRGAPIVSPSAACTSMFSDDSDDVVVTDANFKARRHLQGECLAHPWGCDCEKVQRPTMGQNAAWQVMATRFKSVYSPAVGHQPPALGAPSPAGANAKLERRESELLPNRANGATLLAPVSAGANAPLKRGASEPIPHHATVPNEEDLRGRERRGGKSIEKVLSRLPGRSTGPAVLAVPTRVATKLRLQAEGHDSRVGAASRHEWAKDILPTSRARLSLLSKTTGGVRIN